MFERNIPHHVIRIFESNTPHHVIRILERNTPHHVIRTFESKTPHHAIRIIPIIQFNQCICETYFNSNFSQPIAHTSFGFFRFYPLNFTFLIFIHGLAYFFISYHCFNLLIRCLFFLFLEI